MVRHGARSMPHPSWLCNYCIVNIFFAYVALATTATDGGPVWAAATTRGVAAAALRDDAEGFLGSLARRGLVPDDDRAGAPAVRLATEAVHQMVALLAGDASEVDPLPVDLGDRPAWDRLVLDAVRGIPRGSTASYGEIARRVGRPGAARAVGGAVGRNEVALLVPCHRVVAADGSLGGYGVDAWGSAEAALALKAELLALEGIVLPRSTRVSRR